LGSGGTAARAHAARRRRPADVARSPARPAHRPELLGHLVSALRRGNARTERPRGRVPRARGADRRHRHRFGAEHPPIFRKDAGELSFARCRNERARTREATREHGGALPFTIVVAPDGRVAWRTLGRFKAPELRAAILRTL